MPLWQPIFGLAPALAAISICACARSPAAESSPEAPPPERSEAAGGEIEPELAVAVRVDEGLAGPIAAAGYEGVFVALDPEAGALIVSDAALAERRFIPASTFKIPNSLIALETGVADSPAFTLEWDGVERGTSWDRDHDMASAFAVSAVWYYQELARRIGGARMAEWVEAADYGNADISGGVDSFWLNGELRISPREQVEFLRRVHEGQSPFSPATVEAFLEGVMVVEPRAGLELRAKTGWARSQDFADPSAAGFEGHLGWFVGSRALAPGRQVYFATLIFSPDPAPESFAEDRVELTLALLGELGYAG